MAPLLADPALHAVGPGNGIVPVVRIMPVQAGVERPQAVGRRPGVTALTYGVTRPEHAHQVPVSLLEPRPSLMQVVVDYVKEFSCGASSHARPFHSQRSNGLSAVISSNSASSDSD